jgi:hypothetical protein
MHSTHAERIWLLLLGLTAAGAWLGENRRARLGAEPDRRLPHRLQGRLVIDHYMEMRDASPTIRRVLYASSWPCPCWCC